jgi:hypothetical protein
MIPALVGKFYELILRQILWYGVTKCDVSAGTFITDY